MTKDKGSVNDVNASTVAAENNVIGITNLDNDNNNIPEIVQNTESSIIPTRIPIKDKLLTNIPGNTRLNQRFGLL